MKIEEFMWTYLYEYTLLEGQYWTFFCSQGHYHQVASCEALETIVCFLHVTLLCMACCRKRLVCHDSLGASLRTWLYKRQHAILYRKFEAVALRSHQPRENIRLAWQHHSLC
jgi:hypothetical protein